MRIRPAARRDPQVLQDVLTPVEREFGKCLLDLSCRIRPQVPVGGYAIDFVVEGADDRRLASNWMATSIMALVDGPTT